MILFIQGCAMKAGETEKPLNIVFILSDDQAWNHMGYLGITDFYETPNIDRIANEGIHFTDAYSASPVCSPARASIMTGKNPARLHLTNYIPGGTYPYAPIVGPPMKRALPLNEKILPQYLKDLGYVTGHFGKWHLSPDRLFDEPGRFYEPQFRGFDDVLLNIKPEADHDPFDDPHHVETITQGSIDFIEQNQTNPFFLYVSHHVVHRPLIEEPELIKKYENKQGAELERNNPIMGAMVERMDDGIGRILDKLDELNLRENTVVIFFSDNGGLATLQAQDPLRGGKSMVFEGGIRVPLSIRWPGVIEPGTKSSTPVVSDDFLPTILEMVGSPLHKDDFDGLSFTPLLQGKGGVDREALYWHYPHYHHQGYQPSGAIRRGDYKLIEWYEETLWSAPNQISLFNIRKDIGETTDISNEFPELANSMRRQLYEWRDSVHAQEMMRNPLYDPERAYVRSEMNLLNTQGPGLQKPSVP
ncbi:MAG: sulfatase [Balneolales bacterium]